MHISVDVFILGRVTVDSEWHHKLDLQCKQMNLPFSITQHMHCTWWHSALAINSAGKLFCALRLIEEAETPNYITLMPGIHYGVDLLIGK